MERKWRPLAEEEAPAVIERALTAYGVPLSQVTSFKYLGQVLTAEYKKWIAVVSYPKRARQKWAWMTRILSREGVYAWTPGNIYLAVVQSVLLYGSETWVMRPHIKRVLGVFHHRLDRRLTGRQPQKGRDRVWV